MHNPKIFQINTKSVLSAAVKTDSLQSGQSLVLVVDGVPYTGQKQINGKTIKLLRKGRALHLQVEGQIVFVADDFLRPRSVQTNPSIEKRRLLPRATVPTAWWSIFRLCYDKAAPYK